MKISRSDHVLMLLKSELKRLKSDASSTSSAAAKTSTQAKASDPISRLRNLLDQHELTEPQIHEAVVRTILTDEFGSPIANDPAFIALSAKVTRTLLDDVEGKILMDEALLAIMKR